MENITTKIKNFEVQWEILKEAILEYKEKEKISINWGIVDLEHRARKLEESSGALIYDRTKFKSCLENMITQHNANYGITWTIIEANLNVSCKL